MYEDPVPVVDGMTLKAIAVADRLDPSDVASQQYIVWDSMSHLMNDPGTTRVFWDDFSDSSYTDNWVTYSDTGATFEQANGLAIATITSGQQWSHAYFFSTTGVNVSPTTGKRTEFVVAECNVAPYGYNRTLFLNTQNPSGKGLCMEHQFYPDGDIRLSLYNNGIVETLFDGIDRNGYEYEHTIGLIIDPQTGEWRVGWTWNETGIMVPVGSGVLTPEQIATYLSDTMYIGSGIYSGGYANNTINRTYEVAAYQTEVPPAGTAFTDEFNSLDPNRWFVVTSQAAKGKAVQSNADNTDSQTINFFGTNPASRDISVNSSGQLVLPINAGDTYQNENNYSNVVVARTPENWNTITVKVKGSQAFNDPLGWNQFNIVLWNNDNNLVKFGFSHFDSTSPDPQAGHMVVGGSIETRGVRHTTFGLVDDTISNAIDLVLKVEKNTDGTYKYSISKDNGATMTVVADNIAFAEADGSSVQTPMYAGVYAGAGRWTGTFGSDGWTYDPASNRNVDVLVDSFTIEDATLLPGDANLDGIVNFSDYLNFSVGFGSTGTPGTMWGQGDFNEDGVVNFSDYLLLSSNFGAGGSVSEEEVAKFRAASAGVEGAAQADAVQQTLPCTPLASALITMIGLATGFLGCLKNKE